MKHPPLPLAQANESVEDLADRRRWKIFFWLTIVSTPVMTLAATFGIWWVTRRTGTSTGLGALDTMIGLAVSSGPRLLFFAGCLLSGYCLLRSRSDSQNVRPGVFTVFVHGVVVFFGYTGVSLLFAMLCRMLIAVLS